ncbi:MAG: NAD-dependent deacylase [Alphaproteobacteria bacterium]|nr:NAD-dependent deacylase [Alphaproteobacteria bacterium]
MSGNFERVVILSGAGISAESGLGTFRDKDGLWTKYDLNDVATPEGFARNKPLVHAFYNARRKGLLKAAPNAAHAAIAQLETQFKGDVLVITQNVDDLHERAGSRNLIHMHGELLRALCALCGESRPWVEDLSEHLSCPSCGKTGYMRPDVVWFGEMPYRMDEIYDRLAACDLFVSIGTSGTVYPAAGFVAEARAHGAQTVELNLEPSEGVTLFQRRHHGPATKIVPEYVSELLDL